MKAEKFEKFVDKTDDMIDVMIGAMYQNGVIDDNVKKKDFETAVEIMSDGIPEFNKDVYELGMRMLFIRYEERRQMCEKCEDKCECKGA